MTEIPLVYEDNCLLVLNKPSGWIVNNSNTTSGQNTVQDYLKTNFRYPLADDDVFRSGIVHRLDKETSGLLIIAKDKETFLKLQQDFKDRKIKKTYQALVHGSMVATSGVITATVGRLPWNRRKFGVLAGGREAETFYRLIKLYRKNNEDLSLLHIEPKTGRTHQIRIHLKSLNHPVVGDSLYAGRKTARNDRLWCSRLFLHACGIKFNHPLTGKILSLETKLPQDLENVINNLNNVSTTQIR